jgi:hypothetical protein
VTPYFFEDKSLEVIGWEASSEEGQGHRHLVHSVVARLTKALDWITNFVEKERLSLGESLWKRKGPEPQEDFPGADRVRSQEKKDSLTRLKAVLMQFKENSKHEAGELIWKLHSAAMQSREPFSLLTRAKAVIVSTPHQWGNALL